MYAFIKSLFQSPEPVSSLFAPNADMNSVQHTSLRMEAQLTIPGSVPTDVQNIFFSELEKVLAADSVQNFDVTPYAEAFGAVLKHIETNSERQLFANELLNVCNTALKFRNENPGVPRKVSVVELAPEACDDCDSEECDGPDDCSECPGLEACMDLDEMEIPTPTEFFEHMGRLVCHQMDDCGDCPIPSLRLAVRKFCHESMAESPTPELIMEHGGAPSSWYPPEYDQLIIEIWNTDELYFDTEDNAFYVTESEHPKAFNGHIRLERLILEDASILSDPMSGLLEESEDGQLCLKDGVRVCFKDGDSFNLSPENICAEVICPHCGSHVEVGRVA